MTVWEGFGRFSPFGPRDIKTDEPRPQREQFGDYRRAACLVWLPLVSWGLIVCCRLGWKSWRAGHAPLGWFAVLYLAMSVAVVVMMIPLNWDRYYLPLQAPAAVLASVGMVATIERLAVRERVSRN
jgi:hypothetical protein